MRSQELFQSNGYVYLENFLDKFSCGQHVLEFQKHIKNGDVQVGDEQCPLSYSMGHSALFDSLLEQLTPSMETATGKKLHPTYAYARWYAPGDELKIHRDRPSCEISATINLGFKGNQWPIYMGYDENKQNCQKIDMQVGDAVIYKGEELYHWREKYTEGEWQAQVFVHYVDAEGPNAEWKYDKREKLQHHDDKKKIKSNTDGVFLVKENAFSLESCNKIINSFESNTSKMQKALLEGNRLDKTLRDTTKIETTVHQGVGATLTGIGLGANHHSWKFNITHSNQSEFLKYDKEGHFNQHVDTLFTERGDQTRKLTVILFLNDDFEGGQMYLKIGRDKIYPSQKPGDVLIFPSFFLHGVEPVTSGIRRSIVTWLCGPFFK